MFDLIISGGTMYDGSGAKGFRADLGVLDGRIARIGDLQGCEARCILDARGKAVTPGFIDMHSHADCSVPMWPDMESALGQGITTCFAGHCGMGIAPVQNYWLEQCFESHAMDRIIPSFPGGPIPGTGRVVTTDAFAPAFEAEYGEALDWRSFGEYLEHLRRVGHGANLAINVGHSQLRQQFLGYDAKRAATPAEIREMVREFQKCLDAGAWGLSFGFDYVSSMYAEKDELLALMRAAAERDAVVTAHMQSGPERRGKEEEDFRIYDGFVEFLELGRESGARIHISHIYTLEEADSAEASAPEIRRAVEKVLTLIDRYRAQGVRVTWDYLGTVPAACFFFPQLATRFRPYVDECGGKRAFAKALEQSWYYDLVASEIRQGKHRAVSPFASLGRGQGGRWASSLLITRCCESRYEGKTIGDIAEELGEDCVDTALKLISLDPETLCDRVRCTDPGSGHYYVSDPQMSFGTDNGSHNYGYCGRSAPDLPAEVGTPTEFGGMIEYFSTFPEVPFEQMIQRMCGNAARALCLTDRGFLQPGMWADILILDREHLQSNLSRTNPQTAPDGIDCVIVNGKITVQNKKHFHVRAGQILTRPC